MAILEKKCGGKPVNEFERIVIDYLQKNLPDEGYKIVPNIELRRMGAPNDSGGDRSKDFDGIILSPWGIFILEIKFYQGKVSGDDRWLIIDTPNGSKRRDNPWFPTNMAGKKLRAYLKSQDERFNSIPIDPIVAVGKSKPDDGFCKFPTEVRLSGGDASVPLQSKDCIFPYDQLIKELTRKRFRKDGKLMAWAHHHNDLCNLICQLSIVSSPHDHAVFGDDLHHYHKTEVLSDHRETIGLSEYVADYVYDGRKKDKTVVRLRVFDFNHHASEEDKERNRGFVQQEIEAIQKRFPDGHENLIDIQRVFKDEDSGAIVTVTDWSKKGTLRDCLQKGKPAELEWALDVFEGVAKGVQAIHKQQIIHRALCPGHIFISDANVPKIMNFEYSRIFPTGTVAVYQKHFDTLRLKDARRYAPPDARMSIPDYGNDMYALGWMVYEMLTGQAPSENAHQRMSRAQMDGYNVPESLQNLLINMTTDTSEYYYDIGRVLAALQRIRGMVVVDEDGINQPDSEPLPGDSLPEDEPTPDEVTVVSSDNEADDVEPGPDTTWRYHPSNIRNRNPKGNKNK